MQPSRLLFHLVVVPIVVVVIPSATVRGQDKLCFDVGNFTANDTLQTSLDFLLGSLTTTNSSTMAYGLFNASTSPSQSSEVIETMGYCRGDLDSDACRACLNTSAYSIRQLCPLQKKAIVFDKKCTLKYSNDSLYGVVDLSRGRYRLNGQNTSNWDTFSTGLKKLLDDLRDEASLGGPLRKYAAGNGSADLVTLYATVQCSPDLDNRQCSNCLNRIAGLVPTGKVGARTLWPSCQLRYEIYPFFDPTISLSSPSPQPTMAAVPPSSSMPGSKKSSNTWIIIAASSASAFLLVVLLAFLIAKRRKGRALIRLQNEDADEITMVESLQFNLEVITEATDNFSDAKKLGQGVLVLFTMVSFRRTSNCSEEALKEFWTRGT